MYMFCYLQNLERELDREEVLTDCRGALSIGVYAATAHDECRSESGVLYDDRDH